MTWCRIAATPNWKHAFTEPPAAAVWLAHPAAVPASTTPVTTFAAQSRQRAPHLFTWYR